MINCKVDTEEKREGWRTIAGRDNRTKKLTTIIDDEEIREGLTEDIFEQRTELKKNKTKHIVGKEFSREGKSLKQCRAGP